MARCGYQLQLTTILLVLVLSLCESAEYYIRPTAPTTNTSCPDQQCLTINQYMTNTSYSIQPNTELKFLPGKHILKRPLHIKNVKNVTLKSSTDGVGMYSQLLVKFSCENESLNHCIYTQSAIKLINVTNVVISDISLEMWTPNVSGVIVEQSTDVHLQLDIHYVQGNTSYAIGVAVNETSHLYMDGLRAGNLYYGIRIENTNEIHITNSTLENCQNSGIMMINSDTIDISHTIFSGNQWNGMISCNDVSLKGISVINNTLVGISLESCSNATLINIYATNNQRGISLESCCSMSLKNIFITNNKLVGMHLESCINTTFTSINTRNNQRDGMVLRSCNNTILTSVYAANNQWNGIYFESCSDMSLKGIHIINNTLGVMEISHSNSTLHSIYTRGNPRGGMALFNCSNTTFTSVHATNNRWSGIYLESCTSMTFKDISLINNTLIGMYLILCSGMSLNDVLVTNSSLVGMHLRFCRNTTLTSIHAISNQQNGMALVVCNNMILNRIYANNNELHGMTLIFCTNTTLSNIHAENNQWIGIYLYFINVTSLYNWPVLPSCNNIYMTNISVTNNHLSGMYVVLCSNIYMTNVSATNNQINGMYLFSCSNINMTNISTVNNRLNGMSLELCNSAIIIGISVINSNRMYLESCINTNTQDTCTDAEVPYSEILLRNDDNIRLEDCVFSDIVALSTPNIDTEPHTVPAVIELNNSTLIISNCNFTGNNISSIKAIGSKIAVEGKITFSDNRALSGAALHFASSSVLAMSENSSAIFKNNHAVDYGGAIYIFTDEFYGKSKSIRDVFQLTRPSLVIPSTRCFLSVEGGRLKPKLIFTNNSADKGGDIVYGGLVALGYDGDWNCLHSFKNISDMFQQKGLSAISSAPSRVCLCHEGQPDCLTVADPTTHSIYPGQTITLSVVVVGQDFGTVTGSVIAQFLQTYTACSIHLEPGQRSRIVDNGKCADLRYTLYTSGKENCTAILTLKTNNAEVFQPMNIDDNHKLNHSWVILNEESNYHELAYRILSETIAEKSAFYKEFYPIGQPTTNYSEILMHTIDNFLKFSSDATCKFINGSDRCHVARSVKFVFPKEIYSYPIFFNISFRSCPLGFALSRNAPFKCDCNYLLQLMPRVTCNIQHQIITRDGLVWVGTYHGNETVAASKYCPYNYCKSIHTEITLTSQKSDTEYGNHSTTDFQCSQHHSGILCGGCQPGLSLVLGTNQCLPCSNIYIFLLLPFAMAGLVLVFFIKLLNLTISQGTMNELIFYVNVVSANKHLYYSQTSVNPTTLFIAWLNLDIGIETCFFNGLTAYSRTWLQFVFPLYIWAIAGLIIIAAKYSDRVAKVMGNNGVPVLATLFLLSYAKLFNTIVTAISYTKLYTTQGQKLVWSADGNLDYLSPKHAALFGVAVAALLFLWFPYTLLLLLGQWLHKLNCRLITHMLLNLKPFLDTHFAAFKDNHRYWFGLLLLVRAANLLISSSIPDNTTGIVEFSTAILCVLLTFWGQNVYRSSAVGIFGTAFLLNLVIINVTKLFYDNSNGKIAVASFTLIAVALAQFLGLILYKVFVIFKCSQRITACCAYEKKQNDQWELYEQAAVQREMERDTEVHREHDVSVSIDTVPTY